MSLPLQLVFPALDDCIAFLVGCGVGVLAQWTKGLPIRERQVR
jgi:hypothetical protein